MEKPFKTYDEQLNLLESRGMVFTPDSSRQSAKMHLQRIGYYTLINGYGSLFKIDPAKDQYKQGTTMEEIFNLYCFDKRLHQIFLEYILQFETNIKALIAYYFPASHPETNYLIYSNFDTSKRSSEQYITGLISQIHSSIAGRCSDPSIAHYLKHYGYIPLWVLNNILTLGVISKFYSLMQQSERQSISKIFHLSDNELESILFYISTVRNFCAHGNRLHCFRNKRPLTDMTLHRIYSIPKSPNGEYIYGKRDLFATVIALRLVLPESEYGKFIKDIDLALEILSSQINTITINDVLKCMGFPTDWKKKALIKIV